MLKVAVIGVGWMGQNHVRVYSGLDFVEMAAVADVRERAAQNVARRNQVKGVHGDYRRMLDEVKPDVVSVAVPTMLHREVALAAIERGIHVLIEKPIAGSVTEGAEIVRRANEKKVRLGVGHIERFNPAIVELKRRLDAGELGRVFQIHARRLTPSPGRIDDVGVVLDLSTHDLDIMRYLTGSEAQRVYAEISHDLHEAHEDLLSALIKFKNGVVGTLDANWLTPTKIRELSITGEKGMFLVNYVTQDLYFYQNDYSTTEWEALVRMKGVSEGVMTKLKIDRREPLQVELSAFAQSVLGNGNYTVSGEDGLATLKLAESILASGRAGRAIEVS